MRRGVCEAEGIAGQTTNVGKLELGTLNPPIRHSYRKGDQFSSATRAGQVQKLIYIVSKVFQGPEVRYQTIEKAALAVVFSARRLRHYFQSFIVIVMTDLRIRKVLQKPYVAGRMVRWGVELSEFDVQYESRGPIKG